MKNAVALWRALLVLIVLAFAMTPGGPVYSQESATVLPSLPSPLTPEAISALVSRLSDREVRDLLLQELGAQAKTASAQATPPLSMVDTVTQTLRSATRQIVNEVAAAPHNAAVMFGAIGSYFELLGSSGTFQLFGILALALGIGFVVDRLYARRMAARAPNGSFVTSETTDFPASLSILGRRFLRDAGGAILALIAAIIVLGLLLPEREARVGTAIIVWLVFFPKFVWIVLRFFLSPQRPELRLVTADDWTARVIMRNLVGQAIAIGLNESMLRITQEIAAGTDAQSVGFWINAIIFVWLAAIFIVCRKGLRGIVRGRNEKLTPAEAWVVFAYPGFGLVVIALTWFAGAIAPAIGKAELVREGRHSLSLGLLLIAPLCDTLIRSAVRLLVPPISGSGQVATEAYESAWRSYVRIARAVVFGAIVMILAWLWDVSLFDGGSKPGVLFSGVFFEGLLIAAVGYVALEFTSLVANRKLAGERTEAKSQDDQEADEGPVGGPVSRLATILPPTSWAIQAAIVIITALTALGHIGVNVTALLAGAGVIGIAVGFGAQKLVADVISGLFFLIDDAFRLNEYIDASGVQGTVEKIALRSMLLRQSDGALHCIPYSNISSVTNLGRDWSTMKSVFTVPFDTDIEKVRKIFKKIGQDLYANPEFTGAFIQPYKFKGVNQVNDVGIVVRGKFMFRPEMAKQFLIQREIYRRVNADFAAAGIQFARREVRVSVDTHGAQLTDANLQSIATTAAASVATPDPIPTSSRPDPNLTR